MYQTDDKVDVLHDDVWMPAVIKNVAYAQGSGSDSGNQTYTVAVDLTAGAIRHFHPFKNVKPEDLRPRGGIVKEETNMEDTKGQTNAQVPVDGDKGSAVPKDLGGAIVPGTASTTDVPNPTPETEKKEEEKSEDEKEVKSEDTVVDAQPTVEPVTEVKKDEEDK